MADFDIKKYLIEEMGFPEAEATTMAGNFKPENVAKVQASRSTMEAERAKVTKAQTDLEAANERLNAEMAEWAQLTSAEKASATAQAEKIEKLEAQAFQLQQKLTRVATDAGIDPKTVLPTEPVAEPKK
jgi:septal ring factor EnvC (AmiA/AmiB activator)